MDSPERDGNDRLIRPKEAEALTGLSARSLRRYNALGLLVAKKTPGGHRRYKESDARSLLADDAPEAVAS